MAKGETGTVQLARVLNVHISTVYGYLSKNHISSKGKSGWELFQLLEGKGMEFPESARAKLSPLGAAGTKRANGHASGAPAPKRLDLAKRMYVILKQLNPLVDRARARIAAGTETDDDLKLVMIHRLAQTGHETNFQNEGPDVTEQ
jgi:hypothetical protein